MFGPNGPLPQHLTDFARDRLRNAHDPTLVRFMDIFHHRMLSFFYRAWAINEKSVDFDRSGRCALCRLFRKLFWHWNPFIAGSGLGIGLGKDPFCRPPGGAERETPRDWKQSWRTSSVFPTEIQEFAGYWMKIPKENQCRLGESPETGSLGVNAVAGERKYEVQLKFRIRMGPMELVDLRKSGADWRQFSSV